jgi:hypothetical protein
MTSSQDEPKYQYGLRITDPEKRLRYFVKLCSVSSAVWAQQRSPSPQPPRRSAAQTASLQTGPTRPA